MGCRILVGKEAGTDHEYATFFCSTSMVSFGPVMRSEAEGEAFLKWLEAHPCRREVPGLPVRESSDPRSYEVNALIELYSEFRKTSDPIERGPLVWAEDDACRAAGDWTRMTLAKKWLELFGEEFDHKKATALHDGGDHFQYLMPNGYVVDCACDGDYIYGPAPKGSI